MKILEARVLWKDQKREFYEKIRYENFTKKKNSYENFMKKFIYKNFKKKLDTRILRKTQIQEFYEKIRYKSLTEKLKII